MINILLADDHAIIRKGLKIFISNHISHSEIDEAGDGDIALEKIKQKEYGLIVLDVNMPGIDSFSLVSNIIAIRPAANILMFTMNAEDIYARKYLKLGVKGYLSKASPETEIEKALDNVINGKRYISPALSEAMLEDSLGKTSENPFEKLSPREFEIVRQLIIGKSLSEICQLLNLQPSTVGTHKARIFEKLHCSNVIDLHELAKVYKVHTH